MALARAEQLQRAARLRYEIARVRLALWGVLPVLAVCALAATFNPRWLMTLGLGAAASLVAGWCLWRGRDLRVAALAGVAAGVVPMGLALVASQFHVCTSEGCSTLCLQACLGGGALAGLGVGVLGARSRQRVGFFLAASTVSLLIGAMGCSCIGHAGLVGLVCGFGGGLAMGLLKRAFVK